MAAGFLKAKQTKFAAYVTLYVAIVLGVLGAINFLANRHTQSWDSTKNKRFSLSDQTTSVVGKLNQDAKITVFDQPSRFPAARDLLDRYDALSTKLSVEYIDPEKKPQIARLMGVRNYGQIFIEASGRREEAKSVTEEEVTGALVRALKGTARTICSVTGSGEHLLDDSGRDGYSSFKAYLERNNYKTKDVALLQKAEIPKDCTILMVAGPRQDYLEPSINALKAFVEGGGRALLMVDTPVKFQGAGNSDNAALVKLIESWGVAFGNDVVVDMNPLGQLFGLGALAPLVSEYDSHAIVTPLKGTTAVFPLTRSLEAKSNPKGTVEKLFSSSGNSFTTKDLSSESPKEDKKGPVALGVAGTYDTGKKENQGRFVVTGTSSWVANNFLGRAQGNRDLAVNMMNWLSQDEDLISIRPKEPEDRRLSLSAGQMSRVAYFSLLFLPLLFIGIGVRVWWSRR